MKHLTIIGSNDKEYNVVVENIIESLIEKQKIIYNLYKEKYTPEYLKNNRCNQDMNIKIIQHMLYQLINTFYKYNNKYSLKDNTINFIKYINYILTRNDINLYINSFLVNNSLLTKLDSSIIKLNEIIDCIKLDTCIKETGISNYTLYKKDNICVLFDYILHKIKMYIYLNKLNLSTEIMNEIQENINNINDNNNKIKNELSNNSIIEFKQNSNKLNLEYIQIIDQQKKFNMMTCEFLELLLHDLDLLINNIEKLNKNILNIHDKIIIITSSIFNLSRLLKN